MENEKQYYLRDLETGEKYLVSKEYYDKYMESWNYFGDRMSEKLKEYGKPLIMGTGGDMEGQNEFFKLFYNSNNNGK